MGFHRFLIYMLLDFGDKKKKEVEKALSQIFNESMLTGDVPKEWRDARTMPRF